jgi:hypothetical protein
MSHILFSAMRWSETCAVLPLQSETWAKFPARDFKRVLLNYGFWAAAYRRADAISVK